MYSVSKHIVIGNVGKDCEARYTPNGKMVASFTVGCNLGYGEYKHTEWWTVEMWGKLAENLSDKIKKGKPVYVEGETKTDKYEKDGQKKSFTKIVASTVILLEGKSDENKSSEPEDEIPF